MAIEGEAKGSYGADFWATALAARPCDSCKAAPALLYCRADHAYLCVACDGRLHGANPLALRHERVWMCQVCEQAPAAVTCKADAASLCASCDADIHSANPLARRHDRSPVVPFFEPLPISDPDAATAVSSWFIKNPNPIPKGLLDIKSADYFFADLVDPSLDLDYTVEPFQQIDSVVPVQTKAPPAAAVQPFMLPDPAGELDFTRAKPTCSSYTANSLSQSMSSSEPGEVPDTSAGGAMGDVSNPYGVRAADREARVMRYREKRKNRRFEKTIRYASRKAYAETRPRMKGRFVKRTEIEADVDRIYSSAAAAAAAAAAVGFMADDGGYGVVPTF